jgi:exo-beta-1,3-glucanase (GH17 family)
MGARRTTLKALEPVSAICYSGYRQGQSPAAKIYPTRAQVLEDLRLLAPRWKHLRMYDASPHVELVLEVIRAEKLPLQVMIGAYLEAELSNPQCSWGGTYPAEVLARNRVENRAQLAHVAALANAFPDIVSSVSAGNEATVEWTDHLVPVDHVLEYVVTLKRTVKQPVTFCENYVPWVTKLGPLAAEVDFISLHTYPIWESKGIAEAMAYTQENYRSVASAYPGTPVVITEAGWATASNGRGIEPANASEALQRTYVRALQKWSREQGVLTFVFEAFDEPWKGSAHPDEPEKHWGLFTVDRKAKLVLRDP